MKVQNKLYIAFFIILTVISLVDFFGSLEGKYYFRFQYDLKKTKVLRSFGEIKFETPSYNSLILNEKVDLDPNQTYWLKMGPEKKYIFSFTIENIQKERTKLDGVFWFFSPPVNDKGSAVLEKINLHKKETPSATKVLMLTEESGCCLWHGQKFRLFWDDAHPKLRFIGQKTDRYDYAFSGGKDIGSQGVLKRTQSLPRADIYVLWTGRNDENPQVLVENVKKSIQNIRGVSPKAKIILLYPPPNRNKIYNTRVYENVKALENANFKNIGVIDVFHYIKGKKHWKKDYFVRNEFLSQKAYREIINLLEHEL